MDAAVAVRARIAAAVARTPEVADARLGTITLHPHQCEAVAVLAAQIQRDGGAMLADPPGSGKTFTALAVARDWSIRAGHRGDGQSTASPGPPIVPLALIAAPAALRTQWLDASQRAEVAITFVSLERLSRGAPPALDRASMLIVDEAHQVRTPTTARYRAVAAMAIGRPVLLLTATPVHNRRGDLAAQAALFLGARASALDDAALARLIVRRTLSALPTPRILEAQWHRVATRGAILRGIVQLPPPLPTHDGAAAAALVRQSFARALASSVAGFMERTRRALHRLGALDDALAQGRWPTRRELASWCIGDDASQLVLTGLFDAVPADCVAARFTLSVHRDAVIALRRLAAATEEADTARRWRLVQRILAKHPGAVVLAFSHSAATVRAMWRVARHQAGIVGIIGDRVLAAGAKVSRHELLTALRSDDALPAHFPLRLVFATDVLGEGVDLRRASVVVHLDQPWTPARVAQRDGRAARLGARHETVATYRLRASAALERWLGVDAAHARKLDVMNAVDEVGATQSQVYRRVAQWRQRIDAPQPTVAWLNGAPPCWLAVVGVDHVDGQLLASDGAVGRATASPQRLLEAVMAIDSAHGEAAADQLMFGRVRRAIRRWCAANAAEDLAGEHRAPSSSRRRVLARIDRLIAAAPSLRRGELAVRAAAIRRALYASREVGIDRALDALMLERRDEVIRVGSPEGAACPVADVAGEACAMLDAIAAIIPETQRAAPIGTPRVLALLIVRAD